LRPAPAQIHDRVRDAAGHVDEGEIAELAVRAVEARRELGRQLEDQAGLSEAIWRNRG
jgi:hypothetical protein